MKIALLMISLIMTCYATSELFAIEWIAGYDDNTEEFIYNKVDTVSIDPLTGEINTLLTNLVHASGNWFVFAGLNTKNTKQNELYYSLDLSIGETNSMIPVYGVDLQNQRLLPPIVFDLHFISSLNYDHLNDRLLVTGFDVLPPSVNDSSVLLSYDFKTFRTEKLYTFNGFLTVMDEKLDVENQLLYFIGFLPSAQINFGVLDLKTLKQPRLFSVECTVPSMTGTLRFDAEIGLYAIGMASDIHTRNLSYYFIQYTPTGKCSTHLILEDEGPIAFSTFDYNPKNQEAYIILSTFHGNRILTYNVAQQSLTNNILLSRNATIYEMAVLNIE